MGVAFRALTVQEQEKIQNETAAWLDANTDGESLSFIALAGVIAAKKALTGYTVPATAGFHAAVDMGVFKVRQAFNDESFQQEVEDAAQQLMEVE